MFRRLNVMYKLHLVDVLPNIIPSRLCFFQRQNYKHGKSWGNYDLKRSNNKKLLIWKFSRQKKHGDINKIVTATPTISKALIK